MAGLEHFDNLLAAPLLSALATNPSSATLALVGLATWLSYQLLARPGHEKRIRQATSALVVPEPHTKSKRIRPRRRVA